MSNTSHISPFEVIRRVSDNGIEYWSARDLYKLLGYSSWQKFQFAIDQAKKVCENSGQAVSEHFNLQVKMVQLGSGGQRKTEDHHPGAVGGITRHCAGERISPLDFDWTLLGSYVEL